MASVNVTGLREGAIQLRLAESEAARLKREGDNACMAAFLDVLRATVAGKLGFDRSVYALSFGMPRDVRDVFENEYYTIDGIQDAQYWNGTLAGEYAAWLRDTCTMLLKCYESWEPREASIVELPMVVSHRTS